MHRLYRLRDQVFSVAILTAQGEERGCSEREALEAGLQLPLPHRIEWAQATGKSDSWWICVRDAAGMPSAAFAIDVGTSRALPGHQILRVERLGAGGSVSATQAGLGALGELARMNRRILRIDVEVFCRDSAERNSLRQVLTATGFQERKHARSYTQTLALGLDHEEEAIFAGLPSTTRRHIRAVSKNPTAVRCITDTVYAERLDALGRETMRRTDSQYDPRPWDQIIRFCRHHPNLARLVGLFRTDTECCDALLAFALGLHHGDHVQYGTAASTRRTDLKMPLTYALVWDLVCWARKTGASWFDLGGIPDTDDDHRLRGISDFKRYFSEQVETVGEEWVLEPHAFQAAAAKAVSTGARYLRRYCTRHR